MRARLSKFGWQSKAAILSLIRRSLVLRNTRRIARLSPLKSAAKLCRIWDRVSQRQSRFSAGRECRLSPVRRPSRCHPPRAQSGALPRQGFAKRGDKRLPMTLSVNREAELCSPFLFAAADREHEIRRLDRAVMTLCPTGAESLRLPCPNRNRRMGPDIRRRTGFRTSVRPTNRPLFLPAKGRHGHRDRRGWDSQHALKVAGQGQSHTYETKKRFSPRSQFHLQAPKLRSSEPRDRLLR